MPIFATCVRNISADKTNLRDVLAEKIPKEIQTIKEFRKQHGATKVGEVTVDMVSFGGFFFGSLLLFITIIQKA